MARGAPKFQATALLGLAALAALVGCYAPPLELQVELAGCGMLHADRSCELGDDRQRQVRLLIDTSPSAQLTLFSGISTLPFVETKVGTRRLLRVDLPTNRTRLRVVARRAMQWQSQAVPIVESFDPPWVRQARTLFYSDQARLAKQKLLDGLDRSSPNADARARAKFILGSIAAEEGHFEQALSLLREAAQLDKEVGLRSDEVGSVLLQGSLLARKLRRIDDAESLLKQHAALFESTPQLRGWEGLHLGLYQLLRGNLDSAIDALSAAEVWAQTYGDDEALLEVASLRAQALLLLGRRSEAAATLKRADDLKVSACRRADFLATRAWDFIVSRDSMRLGTSQRASNLERPLLLEALQLARTACRQVGLESKILTSLAFTDVLDGSYDPAKEHLREAQQAQVDLDAERAREWLDLAGRIALGQEQFELARKSFKELAQNAAHVDAYESVWRAQIGLAQATEPTDVAVALDLYRQAEKYLDERSLSITLAIGRGGFLGRYELGTSLLVDLLIRQNQLVEAIHVIRHARVRSLRQLVLAARMNRPDDDTERSRWTSVVSSYNQVRRELERIAAEERGASLKGRSFLQNEREQRMQQLLKILSEAFRATFGEHYPLREPGDAEAILLCHPIRAGWACLAQDRNGSKSVLLPSLDLPRALLAKQMIDPMAEILRRVERVRVISYGEMRKLDVHALPFDGTWLGDKKEVVYALDLAQRSAGAAPATERTASAQPSKQPQALLLFDAQGRLPGTKTSANAISQAFTAAEIPFLMQVGGAPPIGSWPGRTEHRTMSGDELRTLLETVELFHYGGHADYSYQGGWRHSLRTANEAGLFVGDILLLKSVPRWVSLFGCNTGQTAEEFGGQEGVGLGQAFLLRGSTWVLGTIRDVDDGLTGELAAEFYKDPREAMAHPYAALRRALRRKLIQGFDFPQTGKDITPERDLGALRIFVP